MLLGELDAGSVEALALVPVRLVRHRRAEHPEGDLLPVDLGLEAGLELGGLLGLLTRQLSEVALGGEAPQFADVTVAVRRPAESECLVELGQLRIALVDRRELELLLVSRVVEVELLVEVRDEAVGALAEAIEVGRVQRRSGARDAS